MQYNVFPMFKMPIKMVLKKNKKKTCIVKMSKEVAKTCNFWWNSYFVVHSSAKVKEKDANPCLKAHTP